MTIRRFLIAAMAAMCITVPTHAQETLEIVEIQETQETQETQEITYEQHNRFGLTSMFGSQFSYSIEFSYHYMGSPMFGIGFGLGVISQFRAEHVPSGGMQWYIEDNSEGVTNMYFRPSIILSTPLPKKQDFKFHFTAEPSLMLVIPVDRINIGTYRQGQRTHITATSGKKAWWGLKIGPNITKDGLTLGMGYSVSNYDIYALRRNVEFQGTKFSRFYPETKLHHGIYFNLGYMF